MLPLQVPQFRLTLPVGTHVASYSIADDVCASSDQKVADGHDCRKGRGRCLAVRQMGVDINRRLNKAVVLARD